jgi:hypothetical protein
MTLLRHYVIALILIWLYIAWQDGLSDALWIAAAEIAVVYWFYRTFRRIAKGK